jgi:hypothetical protein
MGFMSKTKSSTEEDKKAKALEKPLPERPDIEKPLATE